MSSQRLWKKGYGQPLATDSVRDLLRQEEIPRVDDDTEQLSNRRRRVRNAHGQPLVAHTKSNIKVAADSSTKEKIHGFAEVWEPDEKGKFELHLRRLPGYAAVDLAYAACPAASPNEGKFVGKRTKRINGDGRNFHIDPDNEETRGKGNNARKPSIKPKITRELDQQKSNMFGNGPPPARLLALQHGVFDTSGRLIGTRRRRCQLEGMGAISTLLQNKNTRGGRAHQPSVVPPFLTQNNYNPEITTPKEETPVVSPRQL